MADKFFFYSKSADAPPGKGGGKDIRFQERLNTKTDYTELSKIQNWRKALSNFHVAPFILDDNEWNSVEHFFHAVKFRDNKTKDSKSYKYYETFTLNSGSPWATDPVLAKQAGKAGRVSGTTGKIYDKKIGDVKIPKDITMRHDFYTSKVDSRLQKLAFLAKFTQHENLKRLLLATGDAELWHYTGTRGGGEGMILFDELMIVRDCIRKFDKKCNLAEVSQFSSDFITKILA